MSRNQPFSLEEFHSIYSRVPRLCVDLVIKTDKGILFTLREKNGWIGKWHFPGGTVYINDSLVDTVHRVAQEELGIDVDIVKTLGYIEYPSEKIERGYGYSISVAFQCIPKSQKLKLDDQVAKAKFFLTLPENVISEQKQFLENTTV